MLANKEARSAPWVSDSSIFAIFSASFLVSGTAILLTLVGQQIDIIHDTDDRRIYRRAGLACGGGRCGPAFLGNNYDVAFAGVDGIEGNARVFHVDALGCDLAAKHRPRALVTLVLLRCDDVSDDAGM